jgi:ribosomal protein L35AE/L33A
MMRTLVTSSRAQYLVRKVLGYYKRGHGRVIVGVVLVRTSGSPGFSGTADMVTLIVYPWLYR